MDKQLYVSYLRVSTTEQGHSGLGLEAQRHAVCEYLNRVSSRSLAEFVEIESGSRNDRPQLKPAIDLCKKQKATLIIAGLDRLARNVAFISTLMESGISFLAADNPHANKLMLHMLAALPSTSVIRYERGLKRLSLQRSHAVLCSVDTDERSIKAKSGESV